ncbi:MAG: transglycosylase SLT domain-containing protein [Anaerolineaceae bacterium]|nr:transglycosylase SLT domain-containing protein [Anaerolineaceae bacterium]
MRSIEKAIFPAILAGSLFIFLFSSLVSNPHIVLASSITTQSGGVLTILEETLLPEILPAQNLLAEATNSQAYTQTESQPASESLSTAGELPALEPAATQEELPFEAGCHLADAVPEVVRQWCGLIEASAQVYGLDPNLVAAVIFQESHGDANAYSHSGAVGLMQVMPRDGLAANLMCINGPCFTARPSMAELYDPAFNISYGCGMLSGLINKHGSLREALRAYGPANSGYYYADLVLSLYAQYQ